MSAPDSNRLKIYAYLRQQLTLDECFQASYAMDPYTRWVYRRIRELIWTVSRLGRMARALILGAGAGAPEAMTGLEGVSDSADQKPRILVDVTSCVASGKATGIQRVVRETARHGTELGLALPVMVQNGALVSALSGDAFKKIDPRTGDTFLLLDAGWNHFDEFPPLIDALRASGVKIVAALYDLFPALYPTLYTHKLVADFQAWLEVVVMRADAVVAISRSTAESYLDYVERRQDRPEAGQDVGWWRLGADFVGATDGAVSPQAQGIADGSPFFLGVGTVEPRKGYPVVIDALDRLWAEGVDVTYVIVGAPGWGMHHFEQILRSHPEFGKQLLWLPRAGDADLALLYRRARAMVLASVTEGFGLPIVEAANHGTPVIATDIDVFREVAGDSVQYFTLLDPVSLAARMKEAVAEKRAAPAVSLTSWRDSATQLLTIVRDGSYQSRL